MSPSAAEFVPKLFATAPGNPQPAIIPKQPTSSTASAVCTSPPGEDIKLLEMFQELLNEKKQQFKMLEDCMKEKDESKMTVTQLQGENTALRGEAEVLYC